MNGRIDLASAEAVMELIGAGSEAAARASVRQLEGGVSGFVRGVSRLLLDALSLIEAGVDFPDEVEEEETAQKVAALVREAVGEIERHCDPSAARLLREGASIVLSGRPNVGKSSLMNALLEQDRAIVTTVPGTTRDVLTERISIGGIMAEISDTAGQRETEDPVERIGVDRAAAAVDRADIVLTVIDASLPLGDDDRSLLARSDERTLICINKTDLPPVVTEEQIREMTDAEQHWISADTGEGLGSLREALARRLRVEICEDQLTVERHLRLAKTALEALRAGLKAIEEGLATDVAALDLKEALERLSEITGADPTEELIDEIFSRFCVGK